MEKEPLMVFKNFPVVFCFLIVINRNMLLPVKCEGNAQIYAKSTLGFAPKSSQRPFEQYLKGIGYSLRNA
jgi:hypothetical protein